MNIERFVFKVTGKQPEEIGQIVITRRPKEFLIATRPNLVQERIIRKKRRRGGPKIPEGILDSDGNVYLLDGHHKASKSTNEVDCRALKTDDLKIFEKIQRMTQKPLMQLEVI